MISFKEFITEVEKPTGKLKDACWTGYTAVGMKMKGGKKVPNCVPEEVELHETTKIVNDGGVMNVHHNGQHTGNIMKSFSDKKTPYKAYSKHWDMKNSHKSKKVAVDWLVQTHNTAIKEETELDETAAWQRSAGKDPKGGLNRKGIASYRKEHPGSHLSMAVTTPPSKLDPDSKAAKRRKSFCARMSGMKGAMKKPSGEPTRKALALRKWKCK